MRKRTNERLNEGTNGRTDDRPEERTNERTKELTQVSTNERKDTRTYGRIKGQSNNGTIVCKHSQTNELTNKLVTEPASKYRMKEYDLVIGCWKRTTTKKVEAVGTKKKNAKTRRTIVQQTFIKTVVKIHVHTKALF